MDKEKGQSLELFFIDGKPDGMLTAEVFNWTGHVLMMPRTQLGTGLKRKEASYTGVYLLFGENDDGPLLYVGESDNISQRIRNHDTAKDWWTSVMLVTTAGNNLNKAHAKYLEARLVEQANQVGKTALENGNVPARPSLTEAAQANMENFLEYLFMVLPALRIDSFLQNTRPNKAVVDVATENDAKDVIFELQTPKHDIHAYARLVDGEFVVPAGTKTREAWKGKGSEDSAYGKLFEELVKSGVLRADGDHRVFTENYAFKSPSAAAAVINGRPTNGTLAWKVQGSAMTYKDWEARNLNDEV